MPHGSVNEYQTEVPNVIKQHLCIYCSDLGGKDQGCSVWKWDGVKHAIDPFLNHIIQSSLWPSFFCTCCSLCLNYLSCLLHLPNFCLLFKTNSEVSPVQMAPRPSDSWVPSLRLPEWDHRGTRETYLVHLYTPVLHPSLP